LRVEIGDLAGTTESPLMNAGPTADLGPKKTAITRKNPNPQNKPNRDSNGMAALPNCQNYNSIALGPGQLHSSLSGRNRPDSPNAIATIATPYRKRRLSMIASTVLAAAVAFVIRGWDVRLVLFLAALSLGIVGGDIAPVIREFLITFSNEKFVVPICAAMGFAYVLRQTGCDRHLVRLLIAPVRQVRPMAIPGTIAVGFLVNVPIISQTSTAVCLGPVAVPLLRALGYSPAVVGATLLLGASVGGELFNPGAPELLTVSAKTNVDTRDLVSAIVKPNLLYAVISMISFWWLAERIKKVPPPEEIATTSEGPINLLKACVPLVPLAFLFVTGPPFHLAPIPQRWLIPYPTTEHSQMIAGGPMACSAEMKQDPRSGSRLIGLAMLVGVGLAALSAPRTIKSTMSEFFSGAGYGFTHIVSLIVVANAFGKGIEVCGLSKILGQFIIQNNGLLTPLAAIVPWFFAALCGSGMASTQSLYGFFYDPAMASGADPVSLGSVVSIASAAGRTMSPCAAVVAMCGTLGGVKPWALVKLVAGPLIIGLMVMVTAKMLHGI
jgi:DcuC family C4-dicarboxylate transporter